MSNVGRYHHNLCLLGVSIVTKKEEGKEIYELIVHAEHIYYQARTHQHERPSQQIGAVYPIIRERTIEESKVSYRGTILLELF